MPGTAQWGKPTSIPSPAKSEDAQSVQWRSFSGNAPDETWGIPNTPIYKGAKANGGVRIRAVDKATNTTSVIYNNGATAHFDGDGNHIAKTAKKPANVKQIVNTPYTELFRQEAQQKAANTPRIIKDATGITRVVSADGKTKYFLPNHQQTDSETWQRATHALGHDSGADASLKGYAGAAWSGVKDIFGANGHKGTLHTMGSGMANAIGDVIHPYSASAIQYGKELGNRTVGTAKAYTAMGADSVAKGTGWSGARRIAANEKAAAQRSFAAADRHQALGDANVDRGLAGIDRMTPGTLKDFATSAGYYAGGDNAAGTHTLKQIPRNYWDALQNDTPNALMTFGTTLLPFAVKGAIGNAVRLEARSAALTEQAGARAALGDLNGARQLSLQAAEATRQAKQSRLLADMGTGKVLTKPVARLSKAVSGAGGSSPIKNVSARLQPTYRQSPQTPGSGNQFKPSRLPSVFRPERVTVAELDANPAGHVNARRQTIKYGYPEGNAAGETDEYGNITVRPDRTVREIQETLDHELMHRVFRPRPGDGMINKLRANVGQAAYDHSHLIRFLEEAAAEGYATGDWKKGIDYPTEPRLFPNKPYATPGRVAVEGAAYLGGTMAASQLINDYLFGRSDSQ